MGRPLFYCKRTLQWQVNNNLSCALINVHVISSTVVQSPDSFFGSHYTYRLSYAFLDSYTHYKLTASLTAISWTIQEPELTSDVSFSLAPWPANGLELITVQAAFCVGFREDLRCGFPNRWRTGVRSWSLALSGVRLSQRRVGGCKAWV